MSIGITEATSTSKLLLIGHPHIIRKDYSHNTRALRRSAILKILQRQKRCHCSQ